MRYSPFDKRVDAVEGPDLGVLKRVAEGWYVEYKRELPNARALAKSISAFANQYGGWLFIGVDGDRAALTATAFPGILKSEVPIVLEALRNASKDLLSPDVFYEARVVDGPVSDLGLTDGRAVLIVLVPQAANTPVVHADGRIYRRVADSSDPRPETDRAILDRLAAQAVKAKEKLASFVEELPAISKAEAENCYLHLSILSDPYEIRGDWYKGGYEDFVAVMRSNPLPFDNVFTHSGGFVARQTAGNDPYHRVLTWRFHRQCHSFITLPLNSYGSPYIASLFGYSHAERFCELMDEAKVRSGRVIDLNVVLTALGAISVRHRTLVRPGITGPFFVKAHLQNTWRTIPFIDTSSWVEHCSNYGVPVVQEKNILAPEGTELESFCVIPERNELSDETAVEDSLLIGVPVFRALGIPREFFIKAASELSHLLGRFQEHQRKKNDRRSNL